MALEYFTVGIIVGTHGLRGEVKVTSKTDFERRRFAKGSELMLRRSSEDPIERLVVSTAKKHKQLWLLAFDNHPSINDVEAWKGMELCVHESQLEQLPDGAYYLHELIGLRVVTEAGQYVGELREVLTPGANDVYVVRGPMQAKDVLLPAIPDCIVGVNLGEGTMTVNLLPGLLDADSAADSELPSGEEG